MKKRRSIVEANINHCFKNQSKEWRSDLIEKIWEDEVPSMEGMDPNDPICKAIIQNEKWTNEKIGNKTID